MSYTISFFNRGVEREIAGWPAGIRADFAQMALRMLREGPDLGMPYTRAMGDGLFEIRARGAEGIGRAMYCLQVGQQIVILSAFIKKSQQTPASELKLARKRLKEVKHG